MQEDAHPDSSNDRITSDDTDPIDTPVSADKDPLVEPIEGELPPLSSIDQTLPETDPAIREAYLKPAYQQWDRHMKLASFHIKRQSTHTALQHALLAYELADQIFDSYDPQLARTHERLSAAYEHSGKIIHAETCLKQAIRIHEHLGTPPADCAKKYDRLARLQERIPDIHAVIDSLGRALRLRRSLPQRSHIDDCKNSLRLGRFLLLAGKPDEAEPLLTSSCKRFHDIPYSQRHQAIPLLRTVAEDCLKERQPKLAQRLFQEALYHATHAPLQHTDTRTQILISLGMSYLQSDEHSRGQSILQSAIREVEQECLIYSSARWSRTKLLVQSLMMTGDTDTVESTLEAYIESSTQVRGPLFRKHLLPRTQEARLLLGRSYLSSGNYSKADVVLQDYRETLLTCAPEDLYEDLRTFQEKQLQLLSMTATLCYAAHRYDELEENALQRIHIEESLVDESRETPVEAQRHLRLARLYHAQGADEGVQKSLCRALSILPAREDAPLAWIQCYRLHAQLGIDAADYVSARSSYETALDIIDQLPGTVSLHEHIRILHEFGRILYDSGDIIEAHSVLGDAAHLLSLLGNTGPLHLHIYNACAEANESLGDYASAEHYRDRYTRVREELVLRNSPPYFDEFIF